MSVFLGEANSVLGIKQHRLQVSNIGGGYNPLQGD